MKRLLLFLLFAGGAAFTTTIHAQQNKPPQAPGQTDAIRIGSEEVLLDLVVRDKKGRPIRDLKATDIEVFDDGVKQKLTAFRAVQPSTETPIAAAPANTTTAPASNATPAPATTSETNRQANLVTFVFERLNNESRILARQAAEEFLNNQLDSNVYATVYMMDARLRVIQHFTNDREQLRAAIGMATGQAATQFAERSESIRRELETSARLAEGLANLQGGPGGAPAGVQQDAAAQKFAEMTLNTLRAEDNAEMQVQGGMSVYSLLALVAGQRKLIGRKSVVYFSEGFQVPPNLLDPFRSAISAANRANITFYAFDARGLGSGRQLTEQGDTLMSAARSSQSQQMSRGGQAVTFDQAGIFDTAETSMRKNKQGTLAELAEGTGGFLVANTNDMRKPMQRIVTELSSYYEVSYAPPIREYDGKFHTIT
ncbi:MAG: VWA domain-containing protein, partial [Acidobacteria bacterium]|nr:VWA domain-containing protein [Acidobacteriota bacterium]